MDKRQVVTEIIVTMDNVVPVVQHPDAEPLILLRGERKPYVENGVTIIGVPICQ